jgi:hypothetical protein
MHVNCNINEWKCTDEQEIYCSNGCSKSIMSCTLDNWTCEGKSIYCDNGCGRSNTVKCDIDNWKCDNEEEVYCINGCDNYITTCKPITYTCEGKLLECEGGCGRTYSVGCNINRWKCSNDIILFCMDGCGKSIISCQEDSYRCGEVNKLLCSYGCGRSKVSCNVKEWICDNQFNDKCINGCGNLVSVPCISTEYICDDCTNKMYMKTVKCIRGCGRELEVQTNSNIQWECDTVIEIDCKGGCGSTMLGTCEYKDYIYNCDKTKTIYCSDGCCQFIKSCTLDTWSCGITKTLPCIRGCGKTGIVKCNESYYDCKTKLYCIGGCNQYIEVEGCNNVKQEYRCNNVKVVFCSNNCLNYTMSCTTDNWTCSNKRPVYCSRGCGSYITTCSNKPYYCSHLDTTTKCYLCNRKSDYYLNGYGSFGLTCMHKGTYICKVCNRKKNYQFGYTREQKNSTYKHQAKYDHVNNKWICCNRTGIGAKGCTTK